MKKKVTTLLLYLLLLAGVGLLLYPTLANAWNERIYRHALVNYDNEVSNSGTDAIHDIWQKAIEYNERHAEQGNVFGHLTEEQKADYNEQLLLENGDVKDMIGYLEIPDYSIALPIYRGTSDEVLASGIGHLEGTSLPVGGAGSHCVVSGHTGFPSAKMLTDLEKARIGDLFCIKVLGERNVYEVDQIQVVLPDDFSNLQISDGQDLCTIVTCTPYGINSHRLLVRGHRITMEEAAPVLIVPEETSDNSLFIITVSVILLILFLLTVFIVFIIRKNKKKCKK